MGDKVSQKIVLSMLKFLKDQLDSGTLNEDSSESVEVALQCLESAYNVERAASQARNVPDLSELFSTSSDIWADEPIVEPVLDEHKKKAEALKNIGNSLMKDEKFNEAIDNYTNAIALNPNNAVYYCNRAAAQSKLNNHLTAIQDCKSAIRLDPTYSKAYGRLGIAYSSLNKHEDAKRSYGKALQLEPENESYRNNLRLAHEALLKEQTSGPSALPNVPGLDLASLLQNPQLMNMASQMLSNPNMQNIMSGLMAMGQGEAQGMDGFMQASGQAMAEQLASQNPEFVESMRRQMSENNQPPNQQPSNPDADNKKSQ